MTLLEFAQGPALAFALTVFAVGTLWNLGRPVADSTWASYWNYYVLIFAAASAAVVVWLSVGGFRDLRSMFRELTVLKRDDRDHGFIER